MNQPAQRHGDSVKTMAFTRSVNFRQGIEIGVPRNKRRDAA
jgi:hypothetical protein